MDEELQAELLSYAQRRYKSEKRELISLLDLKEKELADMRQQLEDGAESLQHAKRELDEERGLRAQELAKFETELLGIQQRVHRKEDSLKQEAALAATAIERIKKDSDSYKKQIETLYDENQKVVARWHQEVETKEEQLGALKKIQKELEARISEVELAATREKNELASRALELERYLEETRSQKDDLIAQLKTAIGTSTVGMIEQNSAKKALEERMSDLAKRADDLEKEKARLLADWARERAKWEQLWERERKVWESQKVVIADEHERFGKERSQWEEHLRAKEDKEIKMANVFASMLGELNRWVGYLKYSNVSTAVPAKAQPDAKDKPLKPTLKSRLSGWPVIAAVSLGILAAGVSVARYIEGSAPIGYREYASWEIGPSAVSGISRSGTSIWVADWKTGTLSQLDRDDPSQKRADRHPKLDFYHPNALTVAGNGALFTLDSVAHKIYKHNLSDPSVIAEETPLPTASTLFITMIKGEKDTLAALDTFDKKVYFYEPGALKSKPADGFTLDRDIAATALSGGKDALYVLDAKSSFIYSFIRKKNGKWRAGKRYGAKFQDEIITLGSASAFYIDEDALYVAFEGDPAKLILLR
ncbi:MAG: hypothetical protein AABZ44_01710 [Elusimicrobiota bacterium]